MFSSKRMISVLFAASLFFPLATATDVTRNPALDAQLFTAATQLDRLALLPDDSDWLFDFSEQATYTFSPGSVVNANAATFAAAVDNELTMAVISLGPCGMLPPHYHPRASNYVISISGNTTTYMIEENGARLVTETLTPMKMTIFPRGSMHAMVNNDCTNTQLVSALSNSDQGTQSVVNSLFNLPKDIVEAAFGNPAGGVQFHSTIPAVGTNAIAGTKECLARCAGKM